MSGTSKPTSLHDADTTFKFMIRLPTIESIIPKLTHAQLLQRGAGFTSRPILVIHLFIHLLLAVWSKINLVKCQCSKCDQCEHDRGLYCQQFAQIRRPTCRFDSIQIPQCYKKYLAFTLRHRTVEFRWVLCEESARRCPWR